MKTYIGIDNGVSGTIGVITKNESLFIQTPVKLEQSYTKTKQNINRIDYEKLYSLLYNIYTKRSNSLIIIERPMVNPKRFKATTSALRSLEATLIAVESLSFPYIYEDSKKWQKELLPSGIKGSDKLKKASMDIGCRLFPQHKDIIMKHGDADGILIAEWARRNQL